MEFSRLKKLIAGLSVAAISLTQVGSVLAAYKDVSAGVWYEEAVEAFLDAGYLDASQTRFRGSENANRAEFVKLVVELNGGILSTAPAVASFDDVGKSAWYYGYFEEAGKEGWVRGDKDCYGSHPCYARPSANINRAEAAALIVRAFGLESSGDAPSFVDNPKGQWYTDVVQTAADHCVLQGDDKTGRARPGDNMNRAEMVVMLHRVDQGLTYGVDCGVEEEEEEGEEVELPAVMGVKATSATMLEVEFNVPLSKGVAEDASHYAVGGAGDIAVSAAKLTNDTTVELTLAAAMGAGVSYTLAVTDMEAVGGDTFSDSGAFTGYSPVVLGEGTLEVSVSAKNPSGDTVPRGAVGVVMMSLDLTASCDDSVSVENVTLLHEGFGADTDYSGVYAAIDGTRVTRKRTIDSENQTADLRFSNVLVVPACETVTVDFVGDLTSSATVSAEHNLAVELPTDWDSNAKEVRGAFPLRGDVFRVAAVTSGVVTVAYRTVSPDEVEVGDTGTVIGKFELSTNAVEDQTFYSMTLEQNSSASDGDFVNVAIRRTDGTVLTNVASRTVGDFVTLVFDPPFTLLEGDRITLEVISDVIGGAAKSLIMHFEENSDIFAVGSLYGYGVNGQLYGSQVSLPTESSTLPDTVTIDAGELTVEIPGPPEQTYTNDKKDAVLANILITTGGEPVDIKDLFVTLEAETSTGANLTNRNGSTTDQIHEILEGVEIRNTVTGKTVSAVRLTATADLAQTTGGTYQVYRFDDFIVNGKETWELRVDYIDNGASASPRSGDRFRVHICGEPTHILSSGALTANTTGCRFNSEFPTAGASTALQMQVEGISTGDRVGDVRPRGAIAGNLHRIASAQLTVAQKATGTTDTAVRNARNITLHRFEARAGEAEDILITKFIFDSSSGSLLNGQNYTVWVDTDGDSLVDTILEDGVAAQSSQVTFSDMAGGGYVVPAEDTVVFELHSNVASTLTNNDLRVRFDTDTNVTYIEAEELDDGSSLSGIQTDGTCSTTCAIIVTTVTPKNWLLVDQGSLFARLDTTPLRTRQLLGGALGDPILRLEFRSQNEDIDVTDIQINSSGSTATSIDRLELYKEDAAAPFAYATIGGCGSDDVLAVNTLGAVGGGNTTTQAFCVNMEKGQFVVPEGQRVDVIVRPRLKSDLGGATINQVIHLWLTSQAVVNQASGSGAIRARGFESSNDLIANDGDANDEGEVVIGRDSFGANSNIYGRSNNVLFAKLASIANANPDANGTTIPTGARPFGQFRLTAAANGNEFNGLNQFVLSGLIFNVNATNVLMGSGDQTATATSDFKLYNKNDSSNKRTCVASVVTASGAFTVTCRVENREIDTFLASGGGVTFVLEGDIQNAQVANRPSALQASLQEYNVSSYTTFTTTTSHIQWEDTDSTIAQAFFWVESEDTVTNSTSYKI